MSKQGPKHKNKFAWKPNQGIKINETEPGGRYRPLPDVTGVCLRCKNQIEWKRKYGKYKPLTEPAKCQKCSKRAVRQACLNICTACAKSQGICAKCCCRVDQIIGRDPAEVEAEKKKLDETIKNARERDRRSLLRAMNPKPKAKIPTIQEGEVEGLFSAVSLDEHAEENRDDEDEDKDNSDDVDEDNSDDEDEDNSDDEDDLKVCNWLTSVYL